MTCSLVENLGYSDFSSSVYNQTGNKRIPLSVSVELTLRCNYKCVHCYIPFEQRKRNSPSEMTLAEYDQFFTEIADAGTLWLLLTGGEPLLRPDFLEIYRLAKQKGFIISLFTNGALITEEVAKFLAEYRPYNIEISLYGATQVTYEKVTGIPGSFDRCIRGIELLLKYKLPLKLKTVLLTINCHELQALKELTEKFGLKFSYDPVITTAINGEIYPLQYRLSIETITEIEAADEKRAQKLQDMFDMEYDLGEKADKLYICNAGQTTFHIDPFGIISPCVSARYPSYNLRQGSFKQAWNEFLPEVLARKIDQNSVCATCDLRASCMQCPAYAWQEMGDEHKAVPFLCELTHARRNIYCPACVE